MVDNIQNATSLDAPHQYLDFSVLKATIICSALFFQHLPLLLLLWHPREKAQPASGLLIAKRCLKSQRRHCVPLSEAVAVDCALGLGQFAESDPRMGFFRFGNAVRKQKVFFW